MGVIKKLFYTGVLTGTAFVGYVGATTTIICPLPRGDPIWTSATYQKYNIHHNPATQDVCIKRIPLDKIKPELLKEEGALAREFCRGVWSGWGYAIQRMVLARKYRAETPTSLWTPAQLASSEYEVGTTVTDHFEVVEKTPTSITVRCGDSPRVQQPRESDGLYIVYAEVDQQRREVELGLKSCFFNSFARVEGITPPMPLWLEKLHLWYSRVLMVSAARRLLK